MLAIKVKDSVAVVDPERCIGCGLCVTACDIEAVHMIPRQNVLETPRTVIEMALKIATEKGRADDFTSLMRR